MDEKQENIRTLSGVYFHISDKLNLINKSGKISYMLYLKTGSNFTELQKYIRMLALPYRIVLIKEGDRENIAFVLLCEEDEREALGSIMEWTKASHPEWMVINCCEKLDIPDVIGYRIANNMFHAKRLLLQGEILD